MDLHLHNEIGGAGFLFFFPPEPGAMSRIFQAEHVGALLVGRILFVYFLGVLAAFRDNLRLDDLRLLIEVKASSGRSSRFEITTNEWSTAKLIGQKYYIYRVTQVTSGRPPVKICRDPYTLESKGLLTKFPSGWWIKLE